jgi:hypothetical protein
METWQNFNGRKEEERDDVQKGARFPGARLASMNGQNLMCFL